MVAQREDLELQRRSRAHRQSCSSEKRNEDGQHEREAYPCTQQHQSLHAATSIVATSTNFSTGTGAQGRLSTRCAGQIRNSQLQTNRNCARRSARSDATIELE